MTHEHQISRTIKHPTNGGTITVTIGETGGEPLNPDDYGLFRSDAALIAMADTYSEMAAALKPEEPRK